MGEGGGFEGDGSANIVLSMKYQVLSIQNKILNFEF